MAAAPVPAPVEEKERFNQFLTELWFYAAGWSSQPLVAFTRS